MRHTSGRRRATSWGSAYKGSPSATAKAPEEPPLLVEEGPGTVVCGNCGARVKSIKNNFPESHAPGGYRTNVKRGRVACEGSGSNAARYYYEGPLRLIPNVSKEEALARRLVTINMVADRYRVGRTTLRTLAVFPKPVAILDAPGFAHLYDSEEVVRVMSDYMKSVGA